MLKNLEYLTEQSEVGRIGIVGERFQKKKNATLQKRKRGAQPNNQNAKGGSGNLHPNLPPDRTKHGGYVPVFIDDALDKDEQELLATIPEDTKFQIMEQI